MSRGDYTGEVISRGVPLPPGLRIVAKADFPNGASVYVSDQGHVYSFDAYGQTIGPQTPYFGGYFDLPPEGRQGQRTFVDIEANGAGYRLVANDVSGSEQSYYFDAPGDFDWSGPNSPPVAPAAPAPPAAARPGGGGGGGVGLPPITAPPTPSTPTGGAVTQPPPIGGGGTGVLPTPAETSTTGRSSSAFLRSALQRYGLESLYGWVDGLIRAGETDDEIYIQLYDRPEFRSRFQAIFARADAGLPPLSPEEVLQLEQTYRSVMRSAGLPGGFFDNPDDYVSLMVADVSPTELANRVEQGYSRVMRAAPEVRAAFAQYFGASGDAALAAYFLDATKATPVLMDMVEQAAVGGTGQRFGFAVDRDLATRLVSYGVTQQNAAQGFNTLADLAPLLNETVSETKDLQTMQEGLNAAFGLDATSRQALERRRLERAAAFAGGGGPAQSNKGVVGLGVSNLDSGGP